MKELNPEHVALVASCMSPKKAEKFLASVEVLNESIRLGGWVSRGRAKAGAGFSGFVAYTHAWDSQLYRLGFCWAYGNAFEGEVPDAELQDVVHQDNARRPTPLTVEVLRAWISLCNHKSAAFADLDASRPLPKITPIGLSPKVTATLTEMNLDLDLRSIRVADMDYYEVPLSNADGTPMLTRAGLRVMERVYYVRWSKGILHGMSRFAQSSGCHACGKNIPSRRFVPIEATCRRNGQISMWLGCDCAKNIFGVKDVGLDLTKLPVPQPYEPRTL